MRRSSCSTPARWSSGLAPSEGADVDSGATVIVDFPGEGDRHLLRPDQNRAAGRRAEAHRHASAKGEVSETFAARRRPDRREGHRGRRWPGDHQRALRRRRREGRFLRSMFVRILRAAKKIDGSREEVAYSYGADQNFSLVDRRLRGASSSWTRPSPSSRSTSAPARPRT